MASKATESVWNDQVAELVAVAAAVAAHCESCLRWHRRQARKLGICDEDLTRAVATAQMVKEVPAQRLLDLAAKLGIGLADDEEPMGCCPSNSGDCCAADE